MSLLDRDPVAAVEALVSMTGALSAQSDLASQLAVITRAARGFADADIARIYVLDQTKRFLYLRAAESEIPDAQASPGDPLPLSHAHTDAAPQPLSFCCVSGRVVNIGDIYRYNGFDCQRLYAYDAARGRSSRSLLVVPLRNHREQTLGVLELINYRDPSDQAIAAFPVQLESAVAAFAAQAAVAIDQGQLLSENRRLIEGLDRSNRRLQAENRRLRGDRSGGMREDLIGDGVAMRRVFELMEKVIDSDVTVLIRGETGTGKDRVARALHAHGPRSDERFVAQNCASVPEGLLESELFGFRRGAFTGAQRDHHGLVEQADRGTLFLDEIGDMPLGLQAKLLRFLEDGEARPLGAERGRRVDVRVIAATNADIEQKMRDGEFREDLFYRLCVFPIRLPPLRDRPDDLVGLIDHFVRASATRFGKTVKAVTPAALDALMQHDYPGNVREMRNILERAVLLCEDRGMIQPDHVPGMTQADGDPVTSPASDAPPDTGRLKDAVEAYEAALIRKALAAHAGNQTRAARALSVSRRTLVDKIARYRLRPPTE